MNTNYSLETLELLSEYQEVEEKRIDSAKLFIKNAFDTYRNLYPAEARKVDWEWMREFLIRVVNNELDYLERSPDEYYGLYSSKDDVKINLIVRVD